MTTVPRTGRPREDRPRAAKVPRPRKPVDRRSIGREGTGGPRSCPGWPDQVTVQVPIEPPAPVRRPSPEPGLVRTGASAVLGMLLMAGLLGAVGAIVLLWMATSMLQNLR